MGTVTISLPSDGTTADVADYNTPLTTIQNALNGNIDSNNLASNAVTTAKITDGAVTPVKLNTNGGSTWDSLVWTPSVVGLSATTVAVYRYFRVGKFIKGFVNILGTANATGMTITLPTPAATTMPFFEGVGGIGVSGGSSVYARYSIDTATNPNLLVLYVDAAGNAWSNSGSRLVRINFEYEAAS